MPLPAEHEELEGYIRSGVPDWQEEDSRRSSVLPMAYYVNKDWALILYLRRWRDRSFHYEVSRLRKVAGTWGEDSRGGSGPIEPPWMAWGEQGGPPLKLYESGGWEDLRGGELIESWTTLAGLASPDVETVVLQTSEETVRTLVTSKWGAFILLAEDSQLSPVTIFAETKGGSRIGMEVPSQGALDSLATSTGLTRVVTTGKGKSVQREKAPEARGGSD